MILRMAINISKPSIQSIKNPIKKLIKILLKGLRTSESLWMGSLLVRLMITNSSRSTSSNSQKDLAWCVRT